MASRTHLKFLDAYGVSKFQNMGSRGHFPLSLVTWGKQVIHSSNGLSHTQKGKMNWTNTVPAPINGAPTIQKIIFREEVRQLNQSAFNSKNNYLYN